MGFRMKKLLSGILIVFFALSMTACNKDTDSKTSLSIPGVDGPELSLVDDSLLISVVFEELSVEGGLRYAIPNYPNSYIEVSPDFDSEGTLMAVSVDLDDLFGGSLEGLDPMTLPGGRALPGVASGTLPAVAFTIPQWKNISFYLGSDVFGVFFPISGLGMQGSMITARFYSDGKRTGNISLVGEDDDGENAGFLLLLDLDSAMAKKLKYIANY